MISVVVKEEWPKKRDNPEGRTFSYKIGQTFIDDAIYLLIATLGSRAFLALAPDETLFFLIYHRL